MATTLVHTEKSTGHLAMTNHLSFLLIFLYPWVSLLSIGGGYCLYVYFIIKASTASLQSLSLLNGVSEGGCDVSQASTAFPVGAAVTPSGSEAAAFRSVLCCLFLGFVGQ